MNYFELHIGDYSAATAHLSWDEDLAYRRLISAYYHHERPIPADVKAACRLIRAATAAQRQAVSTVLNEFFVLRDDGWHQRRCDEEIARFQDKQRKAKASANARWLHTDRNANASQNAPPDAMRTHTEGNAPIPRPIPRPNTQGRASPTSVAVPAPDARASEAEPPEANGQPPTAAGAVCRAMRQVGLQAVNPGDPRLLTLLAQKATEAEFVGIAMEAVEKGKGWAWVLATLQGRRADAAGIALAPPVSATVPNRQADETKAMLDAERERERELRTPEQLAAISATIAKARERMTGAA